MVRFVLLFLFFFSTLHLSNAQDTLSFPQSWKGIWKGTLEIYNTKGLTQSVPMELHILPTDSTHRYVWMLIYGEDKIAGQRPYELVILDANKGLYLIDEKNSIQMESYLIKDKFFSRFEVMGNLLLTSVQKRQEELIFEIVVGKIEAISTTGGKKIEKEEIPPVQAFPITIMQRAILKRQ